MFRIPYTFTRTAEGEIVNGRYTDGQTKTFTASANVQPASASDYDSLLALAEGRRIERAVRLYSSHRLQVAGEASRGDRFTFEGNVYEIAGVAPWRSTPLRHYKYLAWGVLEP